MEKMELTLKRKFLGGNYTVGNLFIDGKFFCNTMEDKVRELPASCPYTSKGLPCRCIEKTYGQTAIPAGEYRVTMEYSPKFRRKLPYLHGVPHFLGILVHPGTTQEDSAGCILVGNNSVKGKLTESRATSDRLNMLLSKEKDITIRIANGK